MMFQTAALAILFASTVAADPEVEPCFDNYPEMQFGPDGMKPREVARLWSRKFRQNKREEKETKPRDERCQHDADTEMMILTGAATSGEIKKTIRGMVNDALEVAADQIEYTNWDVGVDLDEYFDGYGFLNNETGNFQQTEAEFMNNGGYEKYFYIGTDPRENDHYATSDESYYAGVAINELFETESKKKFFDPPTEKFQDGCESNTVMCCWHRDRQYLDNNGDCNHRDCVNQNPGDNTDLCWTKEGDEIFPYPDDNIEKNLHCHGISWADLDGSDINSKAAWNSLFYVSMVDHLYARGYVESITNDPKIAGDIPMCGCVEDMAPVVRADCNEVVATANFTAFYDSDSKRMKVTADVDSFELKFQACNGYEWDETTPEEYAVETPDFTATNNDLSGFIFKQWLKGKLTDDQVAIYKNTVVGYGNEQYGNNDIQDKDRIREEICEDAFATKYPNLDYEAIPLEE